MSTIQSIIPLIAGFVLLVKGAGIFVEGASGIALRAGIPPLVVGLTVVALGTSAPEVAIALTSGANSEMAVASVLGSNIVNTLVILGITAIIAEVPIKASTVKVEIPFVLFITLLLIALGGVDGSLEVADALTLLLCLAAYLVYLVFLARRQQGEGEVLVHDTSKSAGRLALMIALGVVGIAVGSNLAVSGATGLARILGMSERVIGLTVIALGTSLPELATTIAAARRGETDIAIGDIVGSSVFNILFVLGVSGIVTPIPFDPSLLFDGFMAVFAITMLWVACRRTQSLRRGWGATMLAGYGAYLAYLLAG